MGTPYTKSANLQEAEIAAHDGDAMKSLSFSLASMAESFERFVLTIESGTPSFNVNLDIDRFPRGNLLEVDHVDH